MKIYAAGWAVQSPALNFLKMFLRLNPTVSISGIVYPKVISEGIDRIPVLDFAEAQRVIQAGDIVLDSHRPTIPNEELHAAFVKLFAAKGITMMRVSDFIGSLIERDEENVLRLPRNGAKSLDIRDLRQEPALSMVKDRFADTETFEVAKTLVGIARSSDWDQMLAFDKDETPESALFQVISGLQRVGFPARFRILNATDRFLSALLELRVQQPELPLSIELTETLSNDLPATRLEFYRRTLGVGESTTSNNSEQRVLLGGDMDTILQAYEKERVVSPSVFFMRRSIVDYCKLRHSLESTEYRISLCQPDTSPENLIAALLV